jgi:hypothetical protein
VCLEAGENGFQTQNNNRNPTAKQVRKREKLHREANKVANTSFSAACLAPEGALFKLTRNRGEAS